MLVAYFFYFSCEKKIKPTPACETNGPVPASAHYCDRSRNYMLLSNFFSQFLTLSLFSVTLLIICSVSFHMFLIYLSSYHFRPFHLNYIQAPRVSPFHFSLLAFTYQHFPSVRLLSFLFPSLIITDLPYLPYYFPPLP